MINLKGEHDQSRSVRLFLMHQRTAPEDAAKVIFSCV